MAIIALLGYILWTVFNLSLLGFLPREPPMWQFLFIFVPVRTAGLTIILDRV